MKKLWLVSALSLGLVLLAGCNNTTPAQNLVLCEWESMDLENAFQIDWASYNTIANEDWWKTMIITTLNWDKFNWRTN